jgi:N-acetylglutamate synthase-like GNAT family acetyltransferase
MQIRVANRQDEPAIREIVNQRNAELGLRQIELVELDSDLNNIDAHYFWYDGIFIVAEEDGQIVGIAGARRGESEDVLEVLRIAVATGRRGKGVGKLMMQTILFFAGNSEYKRVILNTKKHGAEHKEPCLGFTADGAGAEHWTLDIPKAASCSNPS